MTKNEYMNQLDTALKRFPEQTRTDVLEDYEAHFASGMENGRSEEEICEELGPVDLFIEELSQMEAAAAQEFTKTDPQQGDSYTTFDDKKEEQRPIDHASFSSLRPRKLILEGLNADVTAVPAPDDKFLIEYQNHGSIRQQLQYQFYFREENGVIYTGVRKNKNVSFTLSSPSIELRLQIPASMTEASLCTVSGDMEISDIHLREALKLASTSGDITCTHVDATTFTVNSTSGDISTSQTNSATAAFNTVSGDVCASGSYGFTKVNAVSGDIELDTRCDSEVSLSTVSGDVTLHPHASIHGSVRTVSGDIELSLGDTSIGLSIDISTVSGGWDVRRHPSMVRKRRRGGHAEIEGTGCYHIDLATVSGDMTIS